MAEQYDDSNISAADDIAAKMISVLLEGFVKKV